ncbi:Myosin type-2 heavy chain 1, partial [Coemansia sp. RSA 2052]
MGGGVTGSRVVGAVSGGGSSSSSSSGGVLRRQAPTLAAVFRRSLSGLMATLAETEMHYIRCIKPNEAKAAWRLQAPMVLAQLRSCGVIETIRISKAGYPSRVPVRTFNERYSVLLNSGDKILAEVEKHQGGSLSLSLSSPPTRAEHQLCVRILELCLAEDEAQYQVGLTKVFFRAGAWAIMEKKRSSLFEASAVAMQRLCRGALVRRSRARVVGAVVTLQRWFRSCCDKRLVASLRRRHAVRVIERAWAAKCATRRHEQGLAQVAAAICVQALARGCLARRRVKRMRDHPTIAVVSSGVCTAPQPLLPPLPPPPPMLLRSDSEAVSEAFSRLTINSPTSAGTLVAPWQQQQQQQQQPMSPMGSFGGGGGGDVRRIVSQSSEAARQRTAEARASLLAAGVAERKAEAVLPPLGSSYSSTAVSASSSGRNTFGVYSGGSSSMA